MSVSTREKERTESAAADSVPPPPPPFTAKRPYEPVIDERALAQRRAEGRRYLEPCAMEWGSEKQENNVCYEPDSAGFQIRGPNYVADRKKQPSAPAAFSFITLSAYLNQTPIRHIANRSPTLRKRLAEPDCPYLMIVNFLIPHGSESYSIPMVWARTLPEGADAQFDRVLKSWREAGQTGKDARWKMIANITKSPMAVSLATRAMGGMRPVLVGKKIKQQYYSGPNYFEVDVDVATGRIASRLSGVIIGGMANIECNIGFLLEAGHQENELPERLLGCMRFKQAHIKTGVITVDWPETEEDRAAATAASPKSDVVLAEAEAEKKKQWGFSLPWS